MRALILISSFLVLGACSQDDLPKYSKLDGLRILALDLNTPEIQNPSAGAQTVQLTPYLSDIGGSGSIDLTIQSCLDRGVSFGAEPTCEGAADVTTTNSTLTFADAERTGPAAAITVNFTIPANLLSQYAAPLRFNGVAYLITVTATRGTATLKSFRRILLSTKTPNQNPGIADVLAEGTTLSNLPAGETNLSFSTNTNPESYQYMNTKEEVSNLTETFETTWFISDGELTTPRTRADETTKWTPPPTAPTGRSVVVVGVLRDGRGGVSVIIKKL